MDFGGRGVKQPGALQPKNGPRPKSISLDHAGALLASISVLQIHPETVVGEEKLTIQDCQYLASYNWLDTKKPTILVPGTTVYSSVICVLTARHEGSPPAYLPPKHAPKLKQDSGQYFRDPNAARYPQFPLEPAVRALLTLNPDFECAKLDIVGCGGTLGSLVSAARGEDRSFNFGIERICNTIFLVRQGASPKELIEGVYGYGHTFPEAYTSWDADVKGSASHQRLITYRFGNLRCLIRSETDGYFPDLASSKSKAGGPAILNSDDASFLQSATTSLSVSDKVVANSDKIRVQPAGQTIPQDAIFDLKTRSARKDVDIAEFLPRLWVNQTPNLIIARHEFGRFHDIQRTDIRAAVKGWEQKNAGMLERLHALLRQLIEITGQADSSRVQVSREGTGPVCVRKPTREWSALPAKLKMVWEGKAPAKYTPSDSESEDEDEDEDEDDDDYLKF